MRPLAETSLRYTGVASDRDCLRLRFRNMKLLSVTVGPPREVEWKGKLVRTSIFKSPVKGRIRVGKLNLEDDKQSDLSVHGGIDKAVYSYPSEHYAFWQGIPGCEFPMGRWRKFTTEGLLLEIRLSYLHEISRVLPSPIL